MINPKKWSHMGLALALAAVAAGCGKNSGGILDRPEVRVRVADDQAWLEFTGVLKTGNVALPSVILPVRHRGEEVGTLALVSGFGGGTQVTLGVNATRVARLPAMTDATLPNHTAVPLVGVDAFKVWKLEVGSDRSVAYLGLGDGAFFGYSLVIKEMDKVGQRLGTTTVFVPFSYQQVKFSAGAFTSPAPLESGLGAFADVSAYVGQIVRTAPLTLSATAAQPTRAVAFVAPRTKTLDRMKRELYDLQRRPFRATVK